ncbi:MAG: hypothetical protein WBC44_07040 [Planctomycetaceae bacterium]
MIDTDADPGSLTVQGDRLTDAAIRAWALLLLLDLVEREIESPAADGTVPADGRILTQGTGGRCDGDAERESNS